VNWDAIGALAELVGALGVILSLVYLAFQIRQNTNAMRGAAHESHISRVTNVTLGIGTNPQASELIARGSRDFGSLSHTERAQYRHPMGALLIGAEATLYQFKRGNLEEEIWERSRATFQSVVPFPGFHDYWVNARDNFTPGFQAVVDAEIERSRR